MSASGAAAAVNPYLAARREFNEVYGSFLSSARWWRATALVSLGLAAGATGFALWQSTEVKLVPFIVEVDRLGNPSYAGLARQIEYADERVVRSLLADFVTSFKSVTPDGAVQKRAIDRLYAMLRRSSPAVTRINGWYRTEGNNPIERAAAETVSVEVSAVTRLSERSYQIDWAEITRARDGQETGTKRFRGVAAISLVPPQDEAVIRLNPIGLYVDEFDWSGVLQ